MKKRIMLGYERVNEETHRLDFLLEEVAEGDYKMIVPTMPDRNVGMEDAVFVSMDYYQREKKENIDVQFVQVTSENEDDFLIANLDNTKENVIFRVTDVDTDNRIFIVRMDVIEVVTERVKIDEVPMLYYNEEGNLELEEPRYEEKTSAVTTVKGFRCFNENMDQQTTEQHLDKYTEKLLNEPYRRELLEEVKRYGVGLSLTKEILADGLFN